MKNWIEPIQHSSIGRIVESVQLNFIFFKLCDFSDEKINHEKIISDRLNKNIKIENTNQKLLLDENNTFKYNNPICSVCGSHKIIKKGAITKTNKISMETS